MNHYQVTRSLLLDARAIAEGIEHECGRYLLPVPEKHVENEEHLPGWYNQNGYYIHGSNSRVPPKPPLPAILPVTARPIAPYPERAIQIVSSMADYMLATNASWRQDTFSFTMEEIVAPHILSEHRNNEALISRIIDLCLEMRTEIQAFIGQDKWVMHFHSLRRGDIVVEKTIDYRILDWERRTRSGEWK